MPNYTPTKQQEQEIQNWFTYHPPSHDQTERYTRVRMRALTLAETFLQCAPPSADRTAALRKLREAVMTINAAIACGEPEPATPVAPVVPVSAPVVVSQ